MSRCLYCGAELRSATSHFCAGHHILYRNQQIEAWESNPEGSEARRNAARNLRKFPGWWNYDENTPIYPENRGRRQAVAPQPTFNPIDFHFRKFGIELETASPNEKVLMDAVKLVKASGVNIQLTGYTHDHTPYWKVLKDASLSGGYCREIVSPAFTNERGYAEVNTVASTLVTMGVKVNNSCGFHCHLDVSDLTPKQIARIVKFYQVYETEIDKLHQSSRRGNARYTGTLNQDRYANFDPERINTMNDLTSLFYDRYVKVNVQAYLRHGTIEFRQHGATIDPVKIVNWIKFCTRIVEYAKSDNAIDASKPLFEALNLSEAEKLYWSHRKEVLAA